jgi:hypothetical protein
MGKYNNKQVSETKLADHKRVCRVCHLISYHWLCCGQRTARLNLQPTIGSKVHDPRQWGREMDDEK